MRKIILSVLLAASFTLLCFAQDKITDPNLWDFGKVKEGKVFTHEFALKNDSNAPLNIKNVGTSCGCTVSKAKKETLLPKESTTIEVKFNSKGYSGEVKQYVYVATDSVDNPLIRFIIRADVVKQWLKGV